MYKVKIGDKLIAKNGEALTVTGIIKDNDGDVYAGGFYATTKETRVNDWGYSKEGWLWGTKDKPDPLDIDWDASFNVNKLAFNLELIVGNIYKTMDGSKVKVTEINDSGSFRAKVIKYENPNIVERDDLSATNYYYHKDGKFGGKQERSFYELHLRNPDAKITEPNELTGVI